MAAAGIGLLSSHRMTVGATISNASWGSSGTTTRVLRKRFPHDRHQYAAIGSLRSHIRRWMRIVSLERQLLQVICNMSDL